MIAISGATSFTALWICEALSTAGLDVHGLCTESSDHAYSGLKRFRHNLILRYAQIHYAIRAEDGSMAAWIRKQKPKIWIHHHHFMADFRSPEYDVQSAHRVGLEPLPEIVAALSDVGTSAVIFSGSYFEPGEGAKDLAYQPTPYAKSKNDVWLALEKICIARGISCHKIVIPNPIGPFENEDRLIPALIRNSQTQTTMKVNAPSSTADNLSVFTLAAIYRDLIQKILACNASENLVLRPSNGAESNRDLIQSCLKYLVQEQLELKPCPLEFTTEETRISHFLNRGEFTSNGDEFWKRYAHHLKVTHYLG